MYRLYWNIMWRIATPILLFIILLASAVDFQPPEVIPKFRNSILRFLFLQYRFCNSYFNIYLNGEILLLTPWRWQWNISSSEILSCSLLYFEKFYSISAFICQVNFHPALHNYIYCAIKQKELRVPKGKKPVSRDLKT